MGKLWLLKGDLDSPGWQQLRTDHEGEEIDILHLDPRVWAIVEADDPPTRYEGVSAVQPTDGIYIDPNGSPLYLVDGAVVPDARTVVEALGDEAVRLLETVGDPDRVLEQLGRAF